MIHRQSELNGGFVESHVTFDSIDCNHRHHQARFRTRDFHFRQKLGPEEIQVDIPLSADKKKMVRLLSSGHETYLE
jgi:hypothetical protein